MKIYLINKETNEIVRVFENADKWENNFVEYANGRYRAKMYCGENEYFTDKEVIVEE